MNNIFEKINIRKIVIVYVVSIIFTFTILKIPILNSVYLKDKFFAEVILDMLILIWFFITLSKNKYVLKIKIDYRKILYLYALNLGIYIGTALCVFFVIER